MNRPNYQTPPDYYGYSQQPQMEPQYGPNYPQQNRYSGQTTNCDFILVTSLDQVKSYIVYPGQKIYFLDINKSIIYTKEASNLGTTSIEAFTIAKIALDDVGGFVNTPTANRDEEITRLNERIDALEKKLDTRSDKDNRGYNNAKSEKR